MSAAPVDTPALVRIARKAQGMALASAPEIVHRQAALCILDTIGCMLAGARTQEARMVLASESALAEAEGVGRTATVITDVTERSGRVKLEGGVWSARAAASRRQASPD